MITEASIRYLIGHPTPKNCVTNADVHDLAELALDSKMKDIHIEGLQRRLQLKQQKICVDTRQHLVGKKYYRHKWDEAGNCSRCPVNKKQFGDRRLKDNR